MILYQIIITLTLAVIVGFGTLFYLNGIFTNDWKLVWYKERYSTVKKYDPLTGFWDYNARCHYKIQYSPSRNKYRLISKGPQYKTKVEYQEALNKLIEFNTK